MSLRDRLAAHRAYWSQHKPLERTASITLILEEPVDIVLHVAPSKWAKVRSLFPGKTDSEIIDEMVDVLFAQVGLR